MPNRRQRNYQNLFVRFRRLEVAIAALVWLAACPALFAETPLKKVPPRQPEAPHATGPTDYSSPHFLMHTDLDAKDAAELLKRLETMLSLISKYWGRPQAGIVEMYVVKELDKWPAGSINPIGRAKIAAGAGVTLTETLTMGPQKSISKATVYADCERDTPQHEAVHAYCGQTFGTPGPLWYAEGMAEVGHFWRAGDSSVQCSPGFIRYLRSAEPKSIHEIVNAREFSGDSWQNYAWRWALCHLLANNPNYSARFRPLGLGLLTRQPVSFEDTYSAMAAEMEFEYRFFLAHLDQGYRVDLCSWDWKHRFKPLAGSTPLTGHVGAGRGWQASGVSVKAGQKIDYAALGTWQTSKDGPAVGADGGRDGVGQLVATVFHDFKLGKTFPLGAFGTFTAPADGRLFLRCQDSWADLADNKGSLTLKFKLAGQGSPLDRPKAKVAPVASTAEKGSE